MEFIHRHKLKSGNLPGIWDHLQLGQLGHCWFW